MMKAGIRREKRSNSFAFFFRNMATHWELYLFILPALVYVLIYCYYPMYGAQIAFKNFRAAKGILGSEWVGLKHFIKFFSSPVNLDLIRNTLHISLLTLAVGFPIPIIFALLLNELPLGRYKKTVQTVSYAPHFISTVVMVTMINMFFDGNIGVVNKLLSYCGVGPFQFLTTPAWFPALYVLTGVWQNMGWDSVIYISALSSIDPELHEAAMIDGATRLQRIWHINLPGILPTITTMLILASGKIMTVGFEKVFLMQNALNTETSEIISTFVYKMGLIYTQYSYSTAIGLFNSVVNLVLLLTVNAIVKRLNNTSLL